MIFLPPFLLTLVFFFFLLKDKAGLCILFYLYKHACGDTFNQFLLVSPIRFYGSVETRGAGLGKVTDPRV